jgi:large subunit ribosomal protein L7A
MPYDRLRLARKKAVGAKQTLKAISNGTARVVFVASDADEKVTRDILRECRDRGVPFEQVDSVTALGKVCGIQVGAAAAAIIEE